MIERQEIYCHDCGLYVHFDIDVELRCAGWCCITAEFALASW